MDSRKVNVGVTAFVFIRTNQRGLEWLERFADAVRDLPEVVEFYRMGSQVDYLLRVVVPGPTSRQYGRFYKLIGKIELLDVSSSFAMEQIKYTTALPLDSALIADRLGSDATIHAPLGARGSGLSGRPQVIVPH